MAFTKSSYPSSADAQQLGRTLWCQKLSAEEERETIRVCRDTHITVRS